MDDIATLVARLDALEARNAHQEHVIEELNETITRQWKEVDALNRQLRQLSDRIEEVGARGPSEPEPPPPHY